MSPIKKSLCVAVLGELSTAIFKIYFTGVKNRHNMNNLSNSRVLLNGSVEEAELKLAVM